MGSGHTASTQPELGSNVDPTPPAALSLAMRPFGINSNPGDPRLIAMAEQGVTTETVIAACETARTSKPGEAIGTGYVVAIIERWAREASELKATGATQLHQANGQGAPEKFDPVAYVNRNRIKS